jgi:hypothetical protein
VLALHISYSNSNLLLQTLEQLETGSFIDQATRGLFVEVLIHSANTNLVTHVRLLLEFDTSGIVFPTYRITVIEPDMYDTQLHRFRAFLERKFVSHCCERPLQPSPATSTSRALLTPARAVVCSCFLLWFVADELYFLRHMELGDYFLEFDRILSLLLIVLLSAAVGLRLTFIKEYSEMSVPITTVGGANSLIYGISVLEMEKQLVAVVLFLLCCAFRL